MKNDHQWRVGQGLLFLLFPPKCVGCGEFLPVHAGMADVFCPFCRTKWEASRLPLHEKSIIWESPIRGLVSVVGYTSGETDGVAEGLIYHLKHKDERRVFVFAAHELAHPLHTLLAELDISDETVLVTYPPRRPRAVRKEGFDQAKRLAQALSRVEGYQFLPLLERIEGGREQKRLDASERRENARNAYGLKPNSPDLTGKTVILTDDLYTTGATLRTCAELLVEAGATRVILATVGRTKSS